MTKKAIQLMGMKCWKCYVPMGALCIPLESEDTPESIMLLFLQKSMLPICNECIKKNPMKVSWDQMLKEM